MLTWAELQASPYAVAIAYRLYKWGEGESWDALIAIGQGFKGPVHTEVVFPQRGVAYTATTADGPVIRDVTYGPHPDWWDFEPLPDLTDKDVPALFAHAATVVAECKHAGGGYDYVGALRSAWPWVPNREHPWDWWCSETTVDLLQTKGYFTRMPAWGWCPLEVRREPKTRKVA